jgi:hypothetical protein
MFSLCLLHLTSPQPPAFRTPGRHPLHPLHPLKTKEQFIDLPRERFPARSTMGVEIIISIAQYHCPHTAFFTTVFSTVARPRPRGDRFTL